MTNPSIVVGGGGVQVVTSKQQPVNVTAPSEQPVHVVAPSGLPGVPGPPGPPGPPGSGTGGSSFIFQQNSPAKVWTIEHDLGYNANVTVVDSAGEQCEGDVTYAGNTITVTFSAAFSGIAYLS